MLSGRNIFGIGLIILGIIFLISQTIGWNYNLGDFLSNWWPLVFVIFGIKGARYGKSIFFNSGMALFGILLIADNIFNFRISMWELFIPICLILFGASVIFGKNKKFQKPYFEKYKSYNQEGMSINAIFSGVNEKIETNDFDGGEVNVVFGSAKLDLRNASLGERQSFIDANVTFGSLELIVPETWIVELNGSPVFGDVKNNTKPNIENRDNILKINYNLVFGDIKIKNW